VDIHQYFWNMDVNLDRKNNKNMPKKVVRVHIPTLFTVRRALGVA
jgi:hypothetical protein